MKARTCWQRKEWAANRDLLKPARLGRGTARLNASGAWVTSITPAQSGAESVKSCRKPMGLTMSQQALAWKGPIFGKSVSGDTVFTHKSHKPGRVHLSRRGMLLQ